MFNLALRKYEPFLGLFGLQSVCETLSTTQTNNPDVNTENGINLQVSVLYT